MKQQDFIDLCDKHGKICNKVLKRKEIRDVLVDDLKNPSDDNYTKLEEMITKYG